LFAKLLCAGHSERLPLHQQHDRRNMKDAMNRKDCALKSYEDEVLLQNERIEAISKELKRSRDSLAQLQMHKSKELVAIMSPQSLADASVRDDGDDTLLTSILDKVNSK
jgi:hypothetical protein